MKSLYALLALASLTLVSTAKGQILASNTTATIDAYGYYGQSFITPNDGTADILTGFAWLLTPTDQIGTGNLYLFSQPYTGAPSGLSTASEDLLGEAAWNNTIREYDFSVDDITLQPNTVYYVYSDSLSPARVNESGTDVYPDGEEYLASGSGNNYAAVPTQDVAFEAFTPAPTPEPSTYALGGLAVIGFFVMRKFPRRNKAAVRR